MTYIFLLFPCGVIQLHDRIVHALEDGDYLGAGLALGGPPYSVGSFSRSSWGYGLLEFMAPHRHLVVDMTITSARTNTNVPRICARLPLPGSLALGA
jgi:hypothetical protein